MKLIRTARLRVAAAVATGLSAGAWAHGDKARKKTGPVRKEQKDWGIAGDARSVKRSILVGMSDAMRFTPDAIAVRRRETVKFVFRNDGNQRHEYVLARRRSSKSTPH